MDKISYIENGKNTKLGELLPCPHCGNDDFYLSIGIDDISVAWWEHGNRGLCYGFVKCACGAMVLAETDREAFDRWNERRNP